MYARKAATLALRSLLNCVAREYAELCAWGHDAAKQKLTLNFPENGGSLRVPVLYRSATGHHLFGEPLVLSDGAGTNTVSPESAIDIIIQRIEATASDDGRKDLQARAHSSRLLVEAAFRPARTILRRWLARKFHSLKRSKG